MKAIKVILILLLLLVTVVMGGVAGFVALVDPNDFKTQIANKVLEETILEMEASDIDLFHYFLRE